MSPVAAPKRRVVLLGPQQVTPDIGPVLVSLGIRGPVALCHAGYQERESDDAALIQSMGVPATNLTLHARAADVFKADPEFGKAYNARQNWLRHLQSFYRIRLEKADDAARAIAVRHIDAEMLRQEDEESVAQFRQLDDNHFERCAANRVEFYERWKPSAREPIARHRAQLREIIDASEALVISGGHVATLFNRLNLFDIMEIADGKPIIAWSAGAMVLTDSIVLFHDYPPYGSDIAQVLDEGFGRAPGVVVLPNPSRRIRLDNTKGIARFARRMSPKICVAMDPGARVEFVDGVLQPSSAWRLEPSGEVNRAWTGAES